jgi:sigma-E factor negative regulatory protein RseB
MSMPAIDLLARLGSAGSTACCRMVGVMACVWSLGGGVPCVAQAQVVGAVTVGAQPHASLPTELGPWLERTQQATSRRAYTGTFVVSSPGSSMAVARIWHVCDGSQQLERVENLTGAPRTTLRRNADTVTFLPASRTALLEKRADAIGFPALLKGDPQGLDKRYQLHVQADDRVAGVETHVALIRPLDGLRFGYRAWTEKSTGLLVQLQILDAAGQVLEQAAFTELTLNAPVRADKLAGMMADTQGWKIETPHLVQTTASNEGWQIKSMPAGFRPISCHKRPSPVAGGDSGAPLNLMQWVFTDGLATASLFVEPFDAARHSREGHTSRGATQIVLARKGAWWVTAVGEVPLATLTQLARGLDRRN